MEKDPYKNDFGMQISRANRLGDIDFLQNAEKEKLYDPLQITPSEKWNYLHRINIYNPSPPATVRFYLDRGVEVNAQDIYGMTPLHYAMRAKNGDAALLLLQAGADPNIPNERGTIPLTMIGHIPDRLDVLKAMLEAGGNVGYINPNGHKTVLEAYRFYEQPEYFEPAYQPVIKMMEEYA